MVKGDNHNIVIYLNIHSIETTVEVMRINKVNMGKYTNLGEKRVKGQMLKDKNISMICKGRK